MAFDKQEMMDRTQHLAVQVIEVLEEIPSKRANLKIADQVTRSALSVGANYRAACRGKSPADFINKLKIVEEEADETVFFLEVLLKINETTYHKELERLKVEYEKILSTMVASIITMRSKLKSNKKP